MLLALTSCSDTVTETVTYKINEPVFMSNSAFRASVKVSQVPEAIKKHGKICFYEGYLYISEAEKGIHIIDNRNPSSPKNIGFIEVIGNADLSIRNNLLYADSYVDLVWFDVSNPALPVLKGRLEDIFPKALPGVENNYAFDYEMCFNQETDKGIVVGWKLKERTEKFEQYTGGWFWGWAEKDGDYTSNGTASGSTNGVNGSMSRFALYNNNLYAVTENQMTIFDLTGTEPQKAAESIFIGWNVETIFSYKDNMFMGTPTGMLIYSVTDPLKPVFLSSISHIFGCDPVVVDNDLAYVTIHSGDNCGQNDNELFIVDVSDVKNPKKLVSHPMKNPKGLGIDKGMLFLCDEGLKIYKITTPKTLTDNELAHYSGMEGYDLIPFNNVLMMITVDGLYQYDYSKVDEIKFLSKFNFEK
jgi:hypothetical protein